MWILWAKRHNFDRSIVLGPFDTKTAAQKVDDVNDKGRYGDYIWFEPNQIENPTTQEVHKECLWMHTRTQGFPDCSLPDTCYDPQGLFVLLIHEFGGIHVINDDVIPYGPFKSEEAANKWLCWSDYGLGNKHNHHIARIETPKM